MTDYKKLNDIIVEDRFPIINKDDIFDKLGRCQYFTTLDLTQGFHQIEIYERDIHKQLFQQQMIITSFIECRLA